MDKKEADRQIKQMIAFIRQEAKEKAEEIRQKTDEDKTIEKLSYKAKESKIIRQEFDKLRKDKLTQKKIHRSTKINEARFTVMRKRSDLLIGLKVDILEALCEVSKHEHYETFLRYCIVEGLTIIMEENVEVICRKEDFEIVGRVMESARQDFIKLVTREVFGNGKNVPININLTLSQKRFLPPHPSPERKGESCRGGIELSARRGKIKMMNTVESRLDQAFTDQKPTMRAMLFGIRAPPENAHP